MKKMMLLLLVLSVSVFGCTQIDEKQGMENDAADSTAPNEQVMVDSSGDDRDVMASYTIEDVRQHSTEDDCWQAINGKVYDLTEAIGPHPGGQAILEGCGTEVAFLLSSALVNSTGGGA